MSRRLPRALALTATILALTAAPQSAAAAALYFPGQHPAPAEVGELLALGREFWQDRNLEPCQPDVWIVPGRILDGAHAADGAALRNDTAGICQLWLAGDVLDEVRTARRLAGTQDTRAADQYLGALIFHELGHLAGLGHTRGPGLMTAAGGDAILEAGAPWSVRLWARHRYEVLELRRELRLTRLELRALRRHQPRATIGLRFSN